MPSRRMCSVDGCDHESYARGWCTAHYSRWRNAGDPQPDKPVKRYRIDRGCSVEGCAGGHYARGWCTKHYSRWWEGRPIT